MDYKERTMKELEEIKAEVEAAIEDLEKRRRGDARAQIMKIAKESGLSVDEILAAGVQRGAKSGKVLEPKYAHPENPDLVWSGKGRYPQWFRDQLAAGVAKDDMLI